MAKSDEERRAEFERSEFESGRAILLAASILLGLVSAGVAAIKFDQGFNALLWFAGVSIGYPVTGSIASKLSELLARGCRFSDAAWRRDTSIYVALLWPIVLPFHIVIFLPTLVVNAIYKR